MANLASNNARQIYNQIPGLNIYQNDDAGLQLNVGGRGLDPNRTSNFNTRQNGYDISADALGYPESYYTPPAEGLEEIQILRGASSLQYGTQFGGMMSAGLQTTPEFAMEENENTSQSIMIEDHSLDYELTCAEIQSMTPDTEMKSMIIAIKTDCDGELTITLPKDVIDTDENGFFVLVDGDETNHKASSVGEFWTLTIPFSYGSEEIEIIGTFVIPEFGTIAALVLVVAISSILIISAKNKQIFIPRM
jgi:predicted secreted protein with PEFG-CTERM motif